MVSYTLEKVVYKSPGIMGSHEAPVHNCDLPEKDRVPNNYVVFLHPGYSLDQHKQAVGHEANLHSAIEYVFEETPIHGLYYSAELDIASLAAVRADSGVYMVECIQRVYMDDFERRQRF